MSDSPGSAAKKEKAMSSRLLTMKFMQRAAATAAAKESQNSESDDKTHTPKRQRLSTEPASPGTPQSELETIAAALKAEEQKRRDAALRQAAEAGDSEWVLDVPAANIYPSQPYAVAADSLDAEDDSRVGGRRAFGNYKRKDAPVPAPPANDGSDSEQEKAPPPKKSKDIISISGNGGRGAGKPNPFSDSSSNKKKKNKKKRKSS